MKIKTLLLFLLTVSCLDSSFNKELDNWKSKRYNALFAEDGYLNLAGLFLLESGNYTLGSSDSNDFVFPSDFPEKLGTINVNDSIVSFDYLIDINYRDSISLRKISYHIKEKNVYFSWNTFRWYIHSDPGVMSIRLRDLSHPMLNEKLNIDFFQPNKSLVLHGKFIEYDLIKSRKTNNIIGAEFSEPVPGVIKFKIKNKEFSLEPTIAPSGNFFVVFADETNGKQTYGGGRFLYINPPDNNGNVLINFNKSYNPPCVFSSFTTCPLPSAFNTLSIPINAGEKMYNGKLYSSIYE